MQEIIIASKKICSQQFQIMYKCGKKISFCIGRSQRTYKKGVTEELLIPRDFNSPFIRIIKKMNTLIFFSKDGSECKVVVKHGGSKHRNGLIENRFIVM